MKPRVFMFAKRAIWINVFWVIACGGATLETSSNTTNSGNRGEPSPKELYEHYITEASMADAEQNSDDAMDYYIMAADALASGGTPTLEEADARYQAARHAYNSYNREQATQQYEKAIEIYLRFGGNAIAKATDAYTNLGVIWKELHEKGKARSCWQQALELFEQIPAEHQNLSNREKIRQNLRELDEGY